MSSNSCLRYLIDIYDNAEKEHDMLIVSHSKSEWIAVNFGVSQRTAQRWIAEHKEKQVCDTRLNKQSQKQRWRCKQMSDYKEMREGKILLNRFPYNECKDFRRQSQHEKENLYFTTNDDGFFVKMYEAVGNPKADEVKITRYYSESKNKEVRRIVSQKDSDGFEENLPFSTLAECLEHADAYLTLKNPVDFLVDRDGCLCIQHVSNSGVMEELRIVCRDEKVSDYLCSKAGSLRSSLDQEVNNIPERFLVVLADAMYWNNREKIHRFPAENERLEGVYDTYDEAYKVLEEASRSGTPNLTVEIRREIQPDNEDKWCGLIEPPLNVMTTDNHGNISEIETLHFPEQKEIEVVKEKRWRLNESFSPRRRGR